MSILKTVRKKEPEKHPFAVRYSLGLLKKLEPCHQEELFQENLRVQDGDVGCPANQGVGGVGQRMDDIVTYQVAVFVLKHRE